MDYIFFFAYVYHVWHIDSYIHREKVLSDVYKVWNIEDDMFPIYLLFTGPAQPSKTIQKKHLKKNRETPAWITLHSELTIVPQITTTRAMTV